MDQIKKEQISEMLIYGAEILSRQAEKINALNVFPVPDGDTGSNMTMTIQAGSKAIQGVDFETIGALTKTFSKGMLMGARGNSGVILSQFFRGLGEGLADNTGFITIEEFQEALKQGKVRAYDSVMHAVEGTILTVIKDLSEYEPLENEFVEYFQNLIKVGDISLENTPNLLPVLKEVGVVDSGGAGLMEIFKGMDAALNGKKLEIQEVDFETFQKTEEFPMNVEDITFGYCTEMLIRLEQEINIKDVREKLETYGDSIVAIEDDGILKVHVHTEEPNTVFAYGRELGDYVFLKSENMRIQAENAHGKKEAKENGLVVVAPSVDMAKMFSKIQDIEVIVGGQTLNPSAEDVVRAIKATNAKNVIVLPNNSNIIMTAESAKDLVADENINVEIVKTKYMTQALECLINYDATLSMDENKKIMNSVLDKVINIEITKSIKDTKLNGIEIKKDDYLIISQGDLVASVANIEDSYKVIIDVLKIDSLELVNILIGEAGSKKEISNLIDIVEDKSAFLDIEVYETNQPVYNYLISGIIE